MYGNIDVFNKIPPNDTLSYGKCLHFAIKNDHYNILKWFLDRGYKYEQDLAIKSMDYNSNVNLLGCALMYNSFKSIKLLTNISPYSSRTNKFIQC